MKKAPSQRVGCPEKRAQMRNGSRGIGRLGGKITQGAEPKGTAKQAENMQRSRPKVKLLIANQQGTVRVDLESLAQ